MWSRKKHERKQSPVTDAAARFIGAGIIAGQTRLALWLRSIEQRCSLWQKKALLVLFCTGSSLLLLFILAGALTGEQHQKGSVHTVLPGGRPPGAQRPPLLPQKDSVRVFR